MIKYLFLSFAVYLIVSCNDAQSNKKDLKKEDSSESNALKTESFEYEMKTIYSEEQGWGYQILKNGKTLINQPNIPAVQGNKGFSSKKNAEKTGQFVLSKIQKGQFPPMVTPEELDSLGSI
jgi:hypothetical protein